MKQEITLAQYLILGGKLDKIDWNYAYCDYSDKNRYAKIVSYEDKDEEGWQNIPLFHFTFDNGITQRYSIAWIKIKVDFVLSETYL